MALSRIPIGRVLVSAGAVVAVAGLVLGLGAVASAREPSVHEDPAPRVLTLDCRRTASGRAVCDARDPAVRNGGDELHLRVFGPIDETDFVMSGGFTPGPSSATVGVEQAWIKVNGSVSSDASPGPRLPAEFWVASSMGYCRRGFERVTVAVGVRWRSVDGRTGVDETRPVPIECPGHRPPAGADPDARAAERAAEAERARIGAR